MVRSTDEVLGEPAVHRERRDLLAGRDADDARADRIDDPQHLVARHERILRCEGVPARAHRHIRAARAGRDHADTHLSGAGFDQRQTDVLEAIEVSPAAEHDGAIGGSHAGSYSGGGLAQPDAWGISAGAVARQRGRQRRHEAGGVLGLRVERAHPAHDAAPLVPGPEERRLLQRLDEFGGMRAKTEFA